MTRSRTGAEQYAHGTQLNIQIVACWCPGCGVAYGMAEDHREQRRKDHKSFFCTNGCSLSFPAGISDLEKKAARLEREAAQAKVERDAARSLAQRESNRRQLAERQRAAAKGQVTKIKKRVGNGVCPCCNRTFQNLARHMAGQHPEMVAS